MSGGFRIRAGLVGRLRMGIWGGVGIGLVCRLLLLLF